jgi:hypothetical protein
MKRTAVLLLVAVLACVAGAYALFSSQQSASADPAPITVDSVNIGKIDSPAQGPVCSMPYSAEEIAHSASGWGTRDEPACTGGGWGGGSSDGTVRAAWHRYEYDAAGNVVDGTNSPEGTVTLTSSGYQLGTLLVEALDGAGSTYESNSFEVRVNGTLVYTYHATPGGAETWVVHSIDLVNPASSTRSPTISGSSFEAGTGIDPCTISLTVEIKNIGDAWASWSTYGQLGISNLKLNSTDPPALCEADVAIVSQSFLNPPTQIDVSADVPVTLHKVLHNNGPNPGPVPTDITKTATAPAGCTIVPAGVSEQVPLPESVDVTLDEIFTIHCFEPSQHGPFVITNEIMPKDPEIVDPNLGNNVASTNLTVDAIAHADVKIESQQFVNPPATINVSEDVPITLEKILHNNGPDGPVEVEVAPVLDRVNIGYNGAATPCNAALSADEAAHAATGWGPSIEPACTHGNYGGGSDDGNSRLTWHPNEPLGGDETERAASVTLSSGGFKPGILRINALDGLAGVPIPDDSFEVWVNGTLVYTYHGSDPVTTETWVVHSIDLFNPGASSRTPVIPGSSIVAGSPIALANTLVVEIKSIGQKWQMFIPYGQMAVSWVELLGGSPAQVTLPVSDEVILDEPLVIHCLEPSTHTLTVTNTILKVEGEHVVDPDLTNNSAISQLTVDCIGNADVKIIDQSVVVPPEIPVSEDVPVTVEKMLHNNGPYGPVQVEVGAVVDSVNIGYNGAPAPCNAPLSADEAAHAATGWGLTIEPACTHGNYGGGSDDGNSRLVWHPSEPPGPVPAASVTLNSGGFKLGTLRINALDGIANDDPPPADDSFEVWVNGILVYTYHSARFQGEKWVIHNIDLVNPAASSQQPVLTGSSWEAGTGINPWTANLVVEIRAIGGQWHAFNTYGQLAVSWLDLLAGSPVQVELPPSVETPLEEQLAIHCMEPSTHIFTVTNKILKVEGEHVVDPNLANNSWPTTFSVDCIAQADVKIIDQYFDNPPQSIDVSQNVPVTLVKVLHNNGGFPVTVPVTKTAVPPQDCTITPTSYDEQVPLPPSVDVVLSEQFTIRCSQPSTHTFTVSNVVGQPKEPHIEDPDESNNHASTDLTVDALATADVEIVSQAFDNPPASMDVSVDTPVTLKKVLKNNGSFPVTVQITKTATPPADCTITPLTDSEQVALAAGETKTVSEQFTIHCTKASSHTFTVDNVVSQPKEAHISDPNTGNNTKTTQLTVAAIGKADPQVVSVAVSGPTTIDVSANVNITVNTTLQNSVYGPVAVNLAYSSSVPADCTATTVGTGQVMLPVGQTVDAHTWTIHCSQPSTHTFSFTTTITGIKDAHVVDTNPNNNSGSGSYSVNAIGYSDLKVAAQYFENPPTEIPVSQNVTVTLDKVLHNNGPYGPVDALTTTTVTVPTGCTASPNPHTQVFSAVPVSVDVLHHEPFVIHCTVLGPHTFTFDDGVVVTSQHVVDTDPNNNSQVTELTVTAVGAADVKITSASFVDPPTKITLNQPVDITLRKHIHNNGPWTPVNISIAATATAPTGCTVVPKNVPNSLPNVPMSVDQVIEEVWTINCTSDGLKTFVFNNSVDVSTSAVADPNMANNSVRKLLSVRDPAYPYWGDDICDGLDNNGDTVIDEGWDIIGSAAADCLDPALDTDGDTLTNDVDSDDDGDGWSDAKEGIIRTNPLGYCPLDAYDDAWPPDINNNREVNVLDVVRFIGPLHGAAYDRRYDLKPDGKIDILDVVMYIPVLGESCTP